MFCAKTPEFLGRSCFNSVDKSICGTDKYNIVDHARGRYGTLAQTESPYNKPVTMIEGIEGTIQGTEQNNLLVDRRRGGDAPFGTEAPFQFASEINSQKIACFVAYIDQLVGNIWGGADRI